MTNRDKRIEKTLLAHIDPISLTVTNQSHKHRHHAGDDGSGETHYDVMIISHKFDNISKINRHRMVTDLLKSEFDTGLHALSLTLKTASEASV